MLHMRLSTPVTRGAGSQSGDSNGLPAWARIRVLSPRSSGTKHAPLHHQSALQIDVFLSSLLLAAGPLLGCGSSPSDPAGGGSGGSGGALPEAGVTGPIPANGWKEGITVISDNKPITWYPAIEVPVLGNWAGQGGYVAQVFAVVGGGYQANLLHAFNVANDMPVAVLQGTASGETITFTGAGWSGTLAQGHFTGTNGGESFNLQPAAAPPSLGAAPPAGATVLFDGTNLDAWSKKNATNWLMPDGPAQWTLVEGNAVEVVPATDSLITNKEYGDYKLHVEFRTMGTPTNSGVFLMARYETNINEVYGKFDGNATSGFDNCTPRRPSSRSARRSHPSPGRRWISTFGRPASMRRVRRPTSARATVELNGVKVYDQMQLDVPTGAAGRFGEKATGPVMLQEHGMAVQFRNIWLLEASQDGRCERLPPLHPWRCLLTGCIGYLFRKAADSVR